MDKPTLRNKRYSVQIPHSVGYDKTNNLYNQQPRAKSEYFEFRAEDQDRVEDLDKVEDLNRPNNQEDQLYSYALEADGSNGTVSTYAEGRIGNLETYDNYTTHNDDNDTEARNEHTENTDNAKILNSYAHTEKKDKAKISNRYVRTEITGYAKTLNHDWHKENSGKTKISNRNAYSQRITDMKGVVLIEPKNNGSASSVSYNTPVAVEQTACLSDSVKSSGTTYDQIVDVNIGIQAETSNSSTSSSSCSLRRFIVAVVLLVILIAAAVLIYVFVIDKQSNASCESLPTISNGNAKRMSSGKDKITIFCDPGFELDGNNTITCLNDRWKEIPACEPVMCGSYPVIENGIINGSERFFRSKANITCNPGFLEVGGPSTITCLENGSWSSVSECREHPCGLYTLPGDMVAVNDLLLTTMTLCLQCISGLSFVHNSDKCVTCENGQWQGSPKCEIPGTIEFDSIEAVYKVSDPLFLRCVIQNSSEWQSIVLVRSDFNGVDTEPLFEFTNTRGDIKVQKLGADSRFAAKYELTQDGAAVICEVGQAQCKDSGVYICGNIVGAYTSPINVKYTNISVNITDTESGVPEIVVPDKLYEGIETTIACTGELGKDINDTAVGQLVIQIRYKDVASFNTLPSVKNSSLIENCRMKETVVSSVKPEIGMHEAFIRCIVVDDTEIDISSQEILLNIVSPIVIVSPRPSVFNIGENANLTCTINFVDGWDLIEIRKICNKNDIVIARIEIDSHDKSFLIDEHVRLTQIEVYIDSVRFELVFEPVQCNDACGSAGAVEYEAAVRINNGTWIQNLTNIMFQRQPGIPTLQVLFDGIGGNVANFKCTGEIGEPKGYLEIESNFDGSNFTMFLSNRDGYDNNGSGSITSATDISGECSTVSTINFHINNATAKYHNKLLKCISKPSLALENGKPAESEAEVIEIIPDTFCSEPGGFTGALRHPFHCNMFVQCHSGKVSGVPAGCGQDNCFHETTCYPCEQIGGCSVTDIFIDNFADRIKLGDPVTLICKIKDFQGLTDIVVYKDTNNSVISSFLNGETHTGYTRVTENSYITGNSGQLTLFVGKTKCENGGSYQCVPKGTGKHSEDKTYLMLKDADGNNIC